MEQKGISNRRTTFPLFAFLRDSARLKLFLASALILLLSAALVCGVIALVCIFIVKCGFFS